MKFNNVKILYIGNKLSIHGKNPTTIENLGPKLSDTFDLILISSKKNEIVRLFHMCWVTLFEKKVNYVLIDTYSSKAFNYAWSCGLLSLLSKKKYIAFIHGGDFPNRLKKSKCLTHFYLKFSSKIITPSNYLAEEIRKRTSFKPKIIPNFIHLENYQFQLKKGGVIKLLWVRAFKELYNPMMAIEIINNLVKKGKKAELCMVGPEIDGSLKKCKALVMKYKLENNVKFTGLLNKFEWINLAKDYNIFINTTNFDNQPLSVIEAMALGFPIISTNVGGIPYLVKDKTNGYLFPTNAWKEFSEKIIELSENNDKVNFLSKKSRVLAENYDWSIIQRDWIEILTK